jgi:hypothetical protein
LAGARLSAHDFWLGAVDWAPAAGTPFRVTAGHGERFPTREVFRPARPWLADWGVLGADGVLPTFDEFFQHERGFATDVAISTPGAYLAVAVVFAQITEMAGWEFTDYLHEVGLDHVVAAREAAGLSQKPARERFLRYAKIALRNGAGSATHLTRPVGTEAELVPMSDPTTIRPGDALTVQLLFRGNPVKGAAVTAVSLDGSVTGRTDADGRTTLKIGSAGAWLIKTVHMEKTAPDDDIEWGSYWATLAFHTVGD